MGIPTIPNNSSRSCSNASFERVLDSAKRTGVEKAVSTCDTVLSDAAKRKLTGMELTFFVGTKLMERWNIAPGLYAVPYSVIQQQFSKHQQRFGKRLVSPPYDPIVLELDPKDEKKHHGFGQRVPVGAYHHF